MDVLILLLFTALIVIILIPTNQENEELLKQYKKLTHCIDRHEWVKKSNNIDEGYYTVCNKCGFLPDSDDYEV